MYRGLQISASDVEKNLLTDSTINWGLKVKAFEDEMQLLRSEVDLDIAENFNIEDLSGSIDAEKLVQQWFPVSEYDVFLSHSHLDKGSAVRFAVWLHEYLGLRVFVDSTVWGYSDELLRKLDDKYCYQKSSQTYSYEERNETTAHVHLMLAMALQEMIDKSECFVFLKSDNSLPLSIQQESQTKSPWIFEELKTTSIIHKIVPNRFLLKKGMQTRDRAMYAREQLEVNYLVGDELNKLGKLASEDLIIAADNCRSTPNLLGLDAIYQNVSAK
ncbi:MULTISPECIES: TIR domain-containing protein [Furfurilactobacillus]|uniref:TIR domain-containing protein n=1 Tax=Furfurilactobacillus rossiae TaxID=231049 RepID=A0A7C9MSP5_9LACO|nr:hypothetical protein [Furfurilactobacillus milii]MYV06424.1 hypothetical protein [Furfurilactobacillus milii]